ncbi:J domain-containing protein [Synechococcus sp. W4D4]|uniref:J domain-containing protein n=1 Tax=Synechococcus sp. W4D4 TaxID=3392294 RepID=UPI0039E848A2
MSQRETDKRRISLELSEELLGWIDGLKGQLGLRSRGATVERLLQEVRGGQDEDSEPFEAAEKTVAGTEAVPQLELNASTEAAEEEPPGLLDEDLSIVLVHSSLVALTDQGRVASENSETVADHRPAAVGSGGGGIQLPGFVRKQAKRVKQTLEAPARANTSDPTLALIRGLDLDQALQQAGQHWSEVYGQAPTEAALEAAMVWLGRDVWPQSGDSDGRPFGWNLVQQVMYSYAPEWEEGHPTLERVIVAAGILEDPFGGTTLAARVPSLITRFVQRHRTRTKRSTSFDAIDNSMTVHSALRMLQLATVADRPYSLREIREAYRTQAVSHHPDAGGSADEMRRLNEAYQFLKERYREAA